MDRVDIEGVFSNEISSCAGFSAVLVFGSSDGSSTSVGVGSSVESAELESFGSVVPGGREISSGLVVEGSFGLSELFGSGSDELFSGGSC